ncbi:endo-1,4-beta-xylanase [Flavobacterium sp. 245]|uniref:endo-1,4-beta-xylanase n=1 Tax=Flavobacterium sp. 245 TaxID=2512115 RepID=UPI0010622D9B|nr:endo-1,4-beta-xylanase [Flavobacterium sp. 245]TDP00733.1 endo-1,4-beta-xylanase [Flavobacterium sp. 245]
MTSKQYILGALTALLFASCSNDEKVVFINADEGDSGNPNPITQTLKEKAKFKIGAAVKMKDLQNEANFKNAVLKHYSQITAEFEMKMASIWTSSTAYNFTAADYLVGFAKDNNLEVHGHTLVWYDSFPEWFKNAKYDSIAFESKVKIYITDVVGRYKGRVKSWDVVNEVFADGGAMRNETVINSLFKDPIGFYGRCFRYAKAVDPDAKLFYNDYNVVLDAGKRASIKKMVTRFKANGVPIDGVGDQFHYATDTNRQTMKTGFTDMASTGLLIHISELDIKVNTSKSDSYVFTDAEAQKQSETYKYITSMYEELPQNQKFAISTWGVTDKYTWLTSFWHYKEYPLLLDADYNKKPAYQGFLEGLK